MSWSKREALVCVDSGGGSAMPVSLEVLMETPQWAESLEGCDSEAGQLKTGRPSKHPEDTHGHGHL